MSDDVRIDDVTIRVEFDGEEYLATVPDMPQEYEGRSPRKWGAIRELVELTDRRARHFGF